MIKAILLIISLAFFVFELFAQEENVFEPIQVNKIKELEKEIDPDKKNADYAFQLVELARLYSTIKQFDTAIAIAESAMHFAKNHNFKKAESSALSSLGSIYFDQGLFEKSQKTLLLAEISLQNNHQEEELGFIYRFMGQNSIQLKDTVEALHYYQKGLAISKKYQDSIRIGFFYDLMGYTYYWKRDYEKAIYHFKLALNIFKTINVNHRIALAAGNIGLCYLEIGDRLNAVQHYIIAAKHYQIDKNKSGEKLTNSKISDIYKDIGSFDLAFQYNQRNKELYKHEKNRLIDVITTRKDGEIYLAQGNYKKAEQLLLNAFDAVKTIDNSKEKSDITLELAKLYFEIEQFDKAIDFAKESQRYAEKLNLSYAAMEAEILVAASFIHQGQHHNGKNILMKALNFCLNSKITEQLPFIYKNLSHVEEVYGNNDIALQHYKKYAHFSKAVDKNIYLTSKTINQYEQEKREAIAKAKLEQEKSRRNYLFIGLAVAVILFLVFIRLYFLNRKYIKLEKKNVKLQKQRVDELEKMEEFKSRLLTNITHEFRTPLSLIKGNIEILSEKHKNEGLEERFKEIQDSSNNLLALINQLMKLSKIENKQYQLEFTQNGGLIDFINTTINLFYSYFHQKNIQLNFKNLTDSNFKEENFIYSEEAIKSILSNLLSNALKFTPKNGQVNVELYNEGTEFIEIKVIDTGIGVAKEHTEFIFDRFYQANQTSQMAYEGSGIGLAMVKEMALLHGGMVKIETQEGKGTTFIVRLKSNKEAQRLLFNEFKTDDIIDDIIKVPTHIEQPFESTGNSERIELSKEKPIILVIEDHREIRKLITENLGNQYQYIEADNGKTGIKLAQEYLPDLIISDIMMPELDGVSLVRRLKENMLTSHIPIMLLTAKSSFDDKIEGLEIGADDYLTKPFSIKELRLRTKNILKLKTALKRAFSHATKISKEKSFNSLSKLDKEFIEKIETTISANIDKVLFGVNDLADEMCLSNSQLTRKIKALINQTPAALIKTVRIEKAKELIREGYSVAEVAWKVGYEDPGYFSKAFKKVVKKSPSKFREESMK
nr:ATP-binding protein [uncultured Brumimicrobium sp.]